MFTNEVRSLIRYFNQYNRIPNAIPDHYVKSCLNESGRTRQVEPYIPSVLHVNSKGEAGQTVRDETGNVLFYKGV